MGGLASWPPHGFLDLDGGLQNIGPWSGSNRLLLRNKSLCFWFKDCSSSNVIRFLRKIRARRREEYLPNKLQTCHRYQEMVLHFEVRPIHALETDRLISNDLYELRSVLDVVQNGAKFGFPFEEDGAVYSPGPIPVSL
jgi:hypothetical protein